MDTNSRDLDTLFQQLGLPSGTDAVEAFLSEHRPLSASLFLHDAPFWSGAQAAFLRDAIEEDAEWSQAVDTLDAMLRAGP